MRPRASRSRRRSVDVIKGLRELPKGWWFAVDPGATQRGTLPGECLLSTALKMTPSVMLRELMEERILVPKGVKPGGMKQTTLLKELSLIRYEYLKNPESSRQITWFMSVDGDYDGVPPHLPDVQINESQFASLLGLEVGSPLLRSPMKSPKTQALADKDRAKVPEPEPKTRQSGAPKRERPRDVRIDCTVVTGDLSDDEAEAFYALTRRQLATAKSGRITITQKARAPRARAAPPARQFHERRAS